MKIRYEIDLTDSNAARITGGTDLPGAVPLLLRESGILAGGTGYLYHETEPKSQLCLAAADDCGMFLGISAGESISLSLFDADALSDCVDVWGDELLVSRGLFIPVQQALAAIRYFAETGQPDPALEWIAPDALPEDGNYII